MKKKYTYKDPIRYKAIEEYETEAKYSYSRVVKNMQLALLKKINSLK